MSVALKNLTYIDLFAGAGGLSEGFVSVGYKPLAHVEMDPNACKTLMTREAFYYLCSTEQRSKYFDYLNNHITRDQLYKLIPSHIFDSVICETMSDESMPYIFKQIDKSMSAKGTDHVDLILGGPPCQAYSMAGRSRKDMANDPRNTLYKLYFQAIERYKPEMFVFENVPGLLTAGDGTYLREILDGFKARGYKLDYHILNASDYGVLQNRNRIILIGWRENTHHCYPKMRPVERKYLVDDILLDLPSLEPGEEKSEYIREPNDYLRETGIRSEEDVLTWHIARTHQERDREIYRLAARLWKKGKRLKYTDVPESLATHNNRTSFLDRFKVVEKDFPAAHTMVAHISKDGHYYIHPDESQARSISVREAARIQSFPDNFYFEGSRTAAFKQIGNAVPPLLAKEIALALAEQFRE